MSDHGERRSPPRGGRTGNLRSLDRLGYPFDEDEHNRPPETPPYRRNMSQLTLPPEYLSDGGPHDHDDDDDDDIPPVPSRSRTDEKRPADGDNDDIRNGSAAGADDEGHPDAHHTPGGTDPYSADFRHEKNASAGANVSGTDQPGIYDGETLVHGRKDNGKQPYNHYANGQSVHYTDEHGGLLHDAILNAAAADHVASRDFRPPGTRRSSVDSSRAPSVADTDGEEEEPDEFYDWSDEDDLVDQEAHFDSKLNKSSTRKKTWGIRRIATFFVSTLIGTTILTAVLVAVPIALRFLYLLPHPNQHRKAVTQNVSAWLYWAAANLLISWYLAVVVNILPHIVTWFVSVAWGTVTESFKTQLGLYEAFKGWIKPILYAASAWVSWVIIFANIYGLHNTAKDVTSDAAYTDRMYQIIEFLFFFTLLVSLEKIVLQFVAYTFHRAAYQDRLEEVNKALAVFDHLKDYRPKRRTPGTPRGFKSGRLTPPMGFGRNAGNKTPTGLFGNSRPGTPDLGNLEDGFAADTEDLEYFDRRGGDEKKGSGRKSWLHFGHGDEKKRDPRDNGRDGAGGESIPMSPTTRVPGDSSAEAGPSRNTSQDFDNVVRSGNDKARGRGRKDDRRSGSNTPNGIGNGNGNSQAHTYPPTAADVRNSLDAQSVLGGPPTGQDDGQMLTQAAKALKTAILHDARNIKGKDTTEADVSFTITSPHEAKKLARNLYYAFRADKKRTHLIPSDFYPAYPKPEDAKEAFKIFDKDNNENITRAEIKTTVMKIYKERRFLARSLRDVGAALTTLDWIMLVFAMMVLFFVALSVFDVNIAKLLTSVYTLGLALSFIFKNAAASGFDAIMFLFVTHPYDTGDRCFIDGENLVVKKMGLFATTFTRADGTSTYYFNSQLTAKFILNARRSGKTAEAVTLQIDWRTSLEKIDALEKALNHWIDTDENRWYSGNTSIMLQHIDYQRSLEITIGIPHNQNWQDWGASLTRRTAFHAAVNHYCRELGISWANSPQPILVTDNTANQPPTTEDLEYVDEEGEELLSPGGAPSSPAVATSPRPPVQPTLFFVPPKDDKATGLRRRRKGDAGAANI